MKVQRNASAIVCEIHFDKYGTLEIYLLCIAIISTLLTLKHNLLYALFISLKRITHEPELARQFCKCTNISKPSTEARSVRC